MKPLALVALRGTMRTRWLFAVKLWLAGLLLILTSASALAGVTASDSLLAAIDHSRAIELGVVPSGTVYWYGNKLDPPYRVTVDPASHQTAINGLPLRLPTPPPKHTVADSSAAARKIRVITDVGHEWLRLRNTGEKSEVSDKHITKFAMSYGDVVAKAEIQGDGMLAIYWLNNPDPDMLSPPAPKQPQAQAPPKKKTLDDEEGQYVLRALRQGQTLIIGRATMLLPAGMDIAKEVALLRQGRSVENGRIRSDELRRDFAHPDAVKAYLKAVE